MLLSNYLKAAAKTAAAALVVLLAGIGVDVPGEPLEVVLTAIFVGGGSVVLNLVLVWAQRFRFFTWARKLLPGYEST